MPSLPLSRFARLFATLLTLMVAGCAENALSSGTPSDFIVVNDFVVPGGAVHLDPSFGFSLYRGEAGVPTEQRAKSIGRAVGFLVTDTITERLRARGYDAVSATGQTAPSYRALVISGRFRAIDEGQRRRVGNEHSAVVADVQITATMPGGGSQNVQSFSVDSRSAPEAPPLSGATRRETGVDADASKIGAEIARVVTEIARRNNWIPAAR